jgi:hypothetical protein
MINSMLNPLLLVIQSFNYNQGGREVLGRTVVLGYSSWCFNTGSCIFHLVMARMLVVEPDYLPDAEVLAFNRAYTP